MEFRDYLAILGKRIWFFIIVVILITLGTYIFTTIQPKTYDASAFVNIMMRPSSDQQVYYNYDNYYTLQSGSFFADRVVVWLQDPSSIMEIYNKAQVTLPTIKLNKTSKIINGQKRNPASIYVLVNNQDKNVAESLVNSTVDFIKNKTADLNQKGSIKGIDLDISSTVVAERKVSVWFNTGIGLIAGIVVGLALVFFAEYLQKEKKG
ncbi:MAG: Wzz/FepE/Etk N-terminal domain-containing protein [Patescibacteria group bacterium]|nr:Wzz/FepE/Etk N-terminal domain-containing protein [Patescibacteria group bacterium]